jgi:hypothetical protein
MHTGGEGAGLMGAMKILLVLTALAFPALVYAEVLSLECDITFGAFVDLYSFEVDLEKGIIISTYHAAANKDNSVAIDYKIASEAEIGTEDITHKAKLHALDYTFKINRNTFEITRYVSDVHAGEEGRGSCRSIEVSGRLP